MSTKNEGNSYVLSRTVTRAVTYLLLILLATICVIPFYSMMISATHDNATLATTYVLWPGDYFMKNYARMSSMCNIWLGMFNSFFIASCCTLLSAYFGALTAFGFSKYKFRFNKQLFWVCLCTMMIPGQLGMIGYFQLMNSMGLLNNFLALIIPAVATPMTVFWARQYLDSFVPNALLESARIDGCHELVIFHKIIIPIILPAIATQAIFTFVGSWNNFLSPLILLYDQDKFTLPILVQQMQGLYGQDIGVTYLGVAISVVPILILFVICSKKVMSGLTVGAVKE